MGYRDPEFETPPEGWSVSLLKDVVEIHNTKREPLNSQDRVGRKGEYPYCGANGVVDHIDDYKYDGEYVLIAEDGGYWGKHEPSSYIMRGKFWVNNHAHVVRAKDGVTTNKFFSFMVNYLNIDPFIGGDARGKLTKAVLQDLEIPHPKFPEQQRIAQVLSTVQQAIELQERLIRTTTELKRALMQKLFTEGLRGEALKETEIGRVPESWEVVEVGSLIRTQPQNGAFVKDPETGRGYLFANVVDMYREMRLDLSKLARLNVPSESVEQYWLEEGDVLVVRSSLKREGIGQNCIARNLTEPVFYDCHLIRIKPILDRLSPEFLSLYWRADVGKADLVRRSKTTTMTTINQQGLLKALVPVPTLEEQTAIAATIDTVDKRTRAAETKRNALQALFRTLLHELMTGKVRVPLEQLSTFAKGNEIANS